MSKHTVKTIGSGSIVLGCLVMALGSQMQMEAQLLSRLSGQGSIIEPVMLRQAAMHSAAIAPESSAGMLAFGMLMMLLGFGLHAWIVLQNEQHNRTVPVHAADPDKRKKAGKPIRKSRKPLEVIWIERTIRF